MSTSEAETPENATDMSGLTEQSAGAQADEQPAIGDQAMSEEQNADQQPLYEPQTIDINGVRHQIVSQAHDDSGSPVVVLKNEETDEHIILPLSALVSDAEPSAQPVDDALNVPTDGEAVSDAVAAASIANSQQESTPTEQQFAAVASEVDGAALSCIQPENSDASIPIQQAIDQLNQAAASEAAGMIAADQLQALAEQAGVEQQLLLQQQQQQEAVQSHEQGTHVDVNGINGMTDESVLQAAGERPAAGQVTFDPTTDVIDVTANGANGSLEALVSGAVVAGEDGYVIIPGEDGSAAGQQISLAGVIGDGDGSGQTYLIQTDDGLVACSAPPEIVEKAPPPVDPISSNEQAILEAVLASGNFTNGQMIHAVAGDQTMAYTVQISSEGASLIPLGPVNTSSSPKKVMGKTRNQAESMLTTGSRNTTSSVRSNANQSRKSNATYSNSRQFGGRTSLAAESRKQDTNQVTVTRVTPPARSASQSSQSSLASDVSLLTGVTGPSQLAASRRTYSKKNIVWVNPDETASKTSATASPTSPSKAVPALLSTNSNMTISATTVPSPQKSVTHVTKKQNPILTSRSPEKSVTFAIPKASPEPVEEKVVEKKSSKLEPEPVPEPEPEPVTETKSLEEEAPVPPVEPIRKEKPVRSPRKAENKVPEKSHDVTPARRSTRRDSAEAKEKEKEEVKEKVEEISSDAAAAPTPEKPVVVKEKPSPKKSEPKSKSEEKIVEPVRRSSRAIKRKVMSDDESAEESAPVADVPTPAAAPVTPTKVAEPEVAVSSSVKKGTVPKKRVGFTESVSETKRVAVENSVDHKPHTPRRVSSPEKTPVPILKSPKETPKGRRLQTPIKCQFTPYDEEEDRRKLRESVTGIKDKRSEVDSYEVASPNLQIHVRHQTSSTNTPTGHYMCQKCGFNTSRLNNLTLHYKSCL